MKLESRVLSHAKVKEAAAGIVAVKIDPRNPGDDPAAAAESLQAYKTYKTTRYVPELVLVAPDGEAIESIEMSKVMDPEALAKVLREAAEGRGR